MNVDIDNDAANRVLECIWVVALQNDIIWTLSPVEDSAWQKLPEDEATTWLQAILSGKKKMVTRYIDAKQCYAPALRSI